MQIETSRLKPGMILNEDIKGKSGKVMMKRNTPLTELEIEFLIKFLITKVTVKNKIGEKKKETSNKLVSEENNEDNVYYSRRINKAVLESKRMFISWKNNMPIDMYEIRELYIPLYEQIDKVGFNLICRLHESPFKKDSLFYKTTAISLLSVYIAKELEYEKKEWIQIGFGGLFSDSGLAKINQSILRKESKLTYDELKEYEKHPIYSYKNVEKVATLTQAVKMAILQHHERLDGSGYPVGLVDKGIHAYAKIIAVADFFYSSFNSDLMTIQDIIDLLSKESGVRLDKKVVDVLIKHLRLL